MENQIEWFEDYIEKVPYRKGLYFFMKLFLFKFKGIKYRDMFLLLQTIYTKKGKEKEAKEKAMNEIIKLHEYNIKND